MFVICVFLYYSKRSFLINIDFDLCLSPWEVYDFEYLNKYLCLQSSVDIVKNHILYVKSYSQ